MYIHGMYGNALLLRTLVTLAVNVPIKKYTYIIKEQQQKIKTFFTRIKVFQVLHFIAYHAFFFKFLYLLNTNILYFTQLFF